MSKRAAVLAFAVVIGSMAIAPFQAGAKTIKWDPWVRDTFNTGLISGAPQTFDGDHFYWTRAALHGKRHPSVVDKLHQLTLSTNQDRVVATVKGGIVDHITANAGRVAFTTQQTVKTKKGGALVTAATNLFMMTSADAPPTLLDRQLSNGKLKKYRKGRRDVTEFLYACGRFIGRPSLSEQGMLLSAIESRPCRDGSSPYGAFFTYLPSSSTKSFVANAGQQSSGLLEGKTLLDKGNVTPNGEHWVATTRDLSTGAVTEYPLIGDASSMSLGTDGHFAVTSEHGFDRHAFTSTLMTEIFSVGNPKPLARFESGSTGSGTTSTVFCGGSVLVNEEQYFQKQAHLTLRDYAGKQIGKSFSIKTNNYVVSGIRCEGRHATIAVHRAHGLPKIWEHDF